MQNELTTKETRHDLDKAQDAAYSYILNGDLSNLNNQQQAQFCAGICEKLGLNALTRPFEFIFLNRKLTLYAKKDATDQLRKVYDVSVIIASRASVDGVHSVTARAKLPNGRTDESVGAVSIQNLKGDALCNALMKAETKAKRRVTLSICGLGLLDECEIETIPESAKQPPVQPQRVQEIKEAEVVKAKPLKPMVNSIKNHLLRICENSTTRKIYLKEIYNFDTMMDLNEKKDQDLFAMIKDLKGLTGDELDILIAERL